LATAALGLSLAAALGDNSLGGDLHDLPAVLETALTIDLSGTARIIASQESLFVLGRGPGLAIAQELALKVQELGAYFTRAISAAEFLHGPIAAAGPRTGAMILSADQETLPSCLKAYDALQQRGAKPVWLGDGAAGISMFPAPRHREPLLRYLGLQLAGYRLASDLARARGRDPDRPSGLQKITRTL
jgi:glucosamine--fructose-6-phosphate aminotransferase (isomerizing)